MHNQISPNPNLFVSKLTKNTTPKLDKQDDEH